MTEAVKMASLNKLHQCTQAPTKQAELCDSADTESAPSGPTKHGPSGFSGGESRRPWPELRKCAEHVAWRAIPSLPGYEASAHGAVKRTATGRILQPYAHGAYLRVGPFCGASTRKRFVHDLVLEAFVGHRQPGHQARHLNGKGRDNRWPENLAWGTPKENGEDRKRHGTSVGLRGTLAGQTFGNLLVLRLAESSPTTRNSRWVCACSCGREHTVRGDVLRAGRSRSCGHCPKRKRGGTP